MRFRKRAVLAATALLCCGLAARHAQAGTLAPLGLYVGNPNGSDGAAEAAFEDGFSSFSAALKARPKLILTYVDYTQTVQNWPENASWQAWSNAQSHDAKTLEPVIGLPMASIASGSASPDQQFQAFAGGQYDSEIQGVVQAWAAQGFTKMIVRPGWEMNIDGPTYAGDDAQSQADWVAAFRHIHGVLKQAAHDYGVAVKVVWNPSVTNYTNASATRSLYPGDGYVDIIGADMYSDMHPYSDGGSPPTYHDWDTGGEDNSLAQFMADAVNRAHYWSFPAATEWSLDGSGGHSQSFDSLTQFALRRGKAFAVCETGAGNSGAGVDVNDDPTFPRWMAGKLTALMAAGGSVAFLDIWDSNADGNYEFSFGDDNKPLESAAWRRFFGK